MQAKCIGVDMLLGQTVNGYSYVGWGLPHFQVLCVAMGCDYVKRVRGNTHAKVHSLIASNLTKPPSELLCVLANNGSKRGQDANTEILGQMQAAYLSFSHHVVCKVTSSTMQAPGLTVTCGTMLPLPDGTNLSVFNGENSLVIPDDQVATAVARGEYNPRTRCERDHAAEDEGGGWGLQFEPDLRPGHTDPEKCTVSQLKTWLVSHGCSVPFEMKLKEQIVRVVKDAIEAGACTHLSAHHSFTHPNAC